MGHIVGINDYSLKTSKSEIIADLNELVAQEGDYPESGIGEIHWTDRRFDDYDEACEWLENHDGFYWCGTAICPAPNSGSTEKTKKIDELISQIDETVKKVKELMNAPLKRKGDFTTCPECGSKLANSHLRLDARKCPVCSGQLGLASERNFIEKAKEKLKKLDEKRQELLEKHKKTLKKSEKDLIRLVKYEFHA